MTMGAWTTVLLMDLLRGLDLRHILKVQSTGFVDGVDKSLEEKEVS